MTAHLAPGRLLGFSEWGKDKLRRHLDLTALVPKLPDPQTLPRGWDCLIREESERFAKGFWCAEEENAFLLGNTWRYSQTYDRHFYPMSSGGDVLFPEPHWAEMLKGKSFIADVDIEKRTCLIDISAYPPMAHCADPVLYVGGSPNWGHWMADILGRLMALDYFPDLSGYRLAFGGLTQGQSECLDLLGISHDRRMILDLKDRTFGTFSFDHLAVPSSPPLAMAYPWLHKKMAAGLQAKAGRQGPERVYLSRRSFFPAHRVFNQDEVEALLASRGFEIVAAETLGVAELISLLANAKIVLSPIGAGLGNFLLAPQDAVLIHLMPDFLQVDFDKNVLFTNWMRYYYPIRDRLILVFGMFDGQDQQDFSAAHGISGHDRPARYSLADLDRAIMTAEKQVAWQGKK
ncbi:MAG: glycosyltransferase family 61 protein [Alphaproteobacteria bacterium]|nr:glycosyltransferase family 61 protein [Alphaproteobacteria bacterium]